MKRMLHQKRKIMYWYTRDKFLLVILGFFLSCTLLFSQEKAITGIVIDSKTGEPLIGVSITLEGNKTVGAISDMSGNFSLKIPSNAVLSVSYIGYQTQKVNVGGINSLTIKLVEENSSLDEVVVVGYGVQKKKLTTGSTLQVNGNDIQKLSTNSVLGALQSQTPGVNITQSSGMPGETFKVNIRGMGTMGNSSPLYVIDGVAGADINALNPSDIESVDVLKDAASAAIYGARAANGVILVTTKQGKVGKMQLSYDGYIGWQNVYKMPSLLNAKQYMTIENEMRFNEGNTPYDFSKELPANLYNSITNGTWNGTNWMEEIRDKNAITQNHAIDLVGGTEMSKFSIGISYSNQNGILGKPVAPQNDRYTFRVNSDHNVLQWKDFTLLRIGENMTYTFNQKKGIGIGNIYWNDIHNMLTANPLLPMYNGKGNYYNQNDKTTEGWNLDGSTYNPVADMIYERGMNLSRNYNLRSNVYLELQPMKDLKFKSSFGYMMSSSNYRQYTPTYNLSTTVINTKDQVNQNLSSGHNWTLENTISYNHLFNKIHSVDLLIGQSLEKSGMGDNLSVTNQNSIFPGSWVNAWISNTSAVSSQTTVGGYPWGDGALASFFGRINYNYKETYMASVIMRADGSSNFARAHRWGYFPSFSAGWIITNESFMKNTSNWLNFFKLRGSWGENGNCNIDNFQYLATIAFDAKNGYYFGNNKNTLQTGAYANILPNRNVSWEKSQQLDFGFDSRWLDSKLGFIFDWYNKITKDWLVQAPILDIYGTGAPFINGGDIDNKGVEIGLNWNDNLSKELSYGINVNFSTNRNRVTRIANSSGYIEGPTNVLSQGTVAMFRAQVGYPIGYFYGYKTAGIFQNQQEIDTYKKEGKAVLANAQPGDLIYVDVNGDGQITDADKTNIGDPNPHERLSLGFNIGYKGLDFSMSLYGAFGQQIAKSYRSFADNDLQNFTTDIFGRWHGEGTSNKLPRLTSGSNSNWQNISDIYIKNGDYLKMSNITVGYDFKKLFAKLPVSQCRLYFAAQNLFTITGYSGMDPEVGYGAGQSWGSGIDVGFYPSPRTYLIGLNLKF